jgi:hypothetical protein
MHQMDYVSHHIFNTVIKNDVNARRLITITLNIVYLFYLTLFILKQIFFSRIGFCYAYSVCN